MWINRIDTHILPINFQYHAPKTLKEALELLAEYGDEAKVLAGGTDLLVKMKQRILEPRHIISLRNLSELRGIREGESGLYIGAATKLREIERSEIVAGNLPLLHAAVKAIGSVQIRNMGTIGGNLCNASPAADSAVALMALDADLHVQSLEGERVIPIEEFFKGPGITALKPGELLTVIYVPYPPRRYGWAFRKIGRTSLDIATVNAAVLLTLDGGRVDLCRIALGAVAPTPVRARRAEECLTGEEPTKSLLEEASELVPEDISPITDVRGTAEYRVEASKALVKDALMLSIKRLGGG